jgi:preprotein translocase subunit SecE
MEDVSRYLSIAWIVFALIIAWVFAMTGAVTFAAIKPSADTVVFAGMHLSAILGVGLAGGLTAVLYSNQKVQTWSTEVAVELTRVTWPGMDETRRSTIVVIIFAIISSLCLAGFDFVWKFFSDIVMAA